jgi:hypothetical protein
MNTMRAVPKKFSGLCIFQMRRLFLLVLGRNARQRIDIGAQILNRDQDPLPHPARDQAAGGYLRSYHRGSNARGFRGFHDTHTDSVRHGAWLLIARLRVISGDNMPDKYFF